jgi:starch-binding outer membrane protein, SusD/RagB family
MGDRMQERRRTRAPLVLLACCAMALSGGLVGCSPEELVGEGELPEDAQDPDLTRTREGAVAAYYGALVRFRNAVAGNANAYIATSGTLTDELYSASFFAGLGVMNLDQRRLPELVDLAVEQREGGWYVQAYKDLHSVRSQASQAAELLRRYAPDEPAALSGHLTAAEAYAEIYLADLFCSGIPLSTVDFDGDYTLEEGSTTEQVYLHALELLDRALELSADSIRLANFARVGRGRVLLALGRHAEAATAVAEVPEGFEYLLRFDATPVTGFEESNASFLDLLGGPSSPFKPNPGMADREGARGLDFTSSGDPRTAALDNGPASFFDPSLRQYLPRKYATVVDPPLFAGDVPVPLADWREARLIEAEAALQAAAVPAFLEKLNQLRRAYDPVALPDLTDPGDHDLRVDLLFRERAFWLYLTGHRQGDLRRLIRQYGRDPGSVYPGGLHPAGTVYGTDITAPVPAAERAHNRRYTGCIHRGA